MAQNAQRIADGNGDLLSVIAEAVHRTDHRTAETAAAVSALAARLDALADRLNALDAKADVLAATVGRLEEEWRTYEPVVSAFRRGGILAARTAARNGRR